MSKITFLFFLILILDSSVSYSKNDVPDTSFDEDGKLYLNFSGYTESQNSKVLVQPDDKIVAEKVHHNHGSNQQIFIPLNKGDHSPDISFESNSLIGSSFSSVSILQMLIFNPNNKILITRDFDGNSPDYHVRTFLVRYSVYGTIDSGFVVNEIVNIESALCHLKAVVIDLCSIDGRKAANLMKNQNFQSGSNSQRFILPGTLAEGYIF